MPSPTTLDNDGIVDALSTEQYCSNLLEKYVVPSELPRECHKFQAAVQRRQSNREDQAIAFAGMNAHETLEAIRAREHGMPHHAKIQRRMTSNNGSHDSSRNPWF